MPRTPASPSTTGALTRRGRPQGLAVEIGVDEQAGEVGQVGAAVDEAGDHGGAAGVAVLGDGIDEAGAGTHVSWPKQSRPSLMFQP